MKTILLSACAAILLAVGASGASADDDRYYDEGYYGGGYYGGNSWRYQNQGYDPYGYEYGVVPPRAIVYDLQRQGFTYISRPALAGQFYQVKARDPYGRNVKLYIDAYSGRIVKVKG
jgi:Peptidase propeptide and YPEB domain